MAPYRFLDYYAKFDWDNYCISLDGPICKSSLLPSLAVDLDNQGTDVLLGAEFRKNCMDMFIVPSKEDDTDLRTFNLKNLNIIDPLKENNNLGRSVHKGNYFRIKSAFKYGAKRLGKILQQSNINIKDEIKVFFKNTLQRHKPKYGPDSTLIFAANGFGEAYHEDDLYSRVSNGEFDDYMNDHKAPTLTESNLQKNLESVDERTTLELWIERGSELVDGDTVCLCLNKGNNNNSSDAKEKNVTDDGIGETEILNHFLDLTGEYDAHIRSLLYGQGCHGYALSTSMVWVSPSPPMNPCDLAASAHSWPVPFLQKMVPQVNANGALMGHPMYNNVSNGNVGNVVVHGTGPHVSAMSCNICEDRQPPRRGRGRGRGRGPRVSNGPHVHRAQAGSGEPKLAFEANHASQNSLKWSPKQARANASLSNQTHRQGSQADSTANDIENRPRKLEFGSFGSMPKKPANGQVNAYDRKQTRIKENALRLKNEDEFPPL